MPSDEVQSHDFQLSTVSGGAGARPWDGGRAAAGGGGWLLFVGGDNLSET